MDSVRAGPFGQLFRPDNFVFGQTGLGRLDNVAMKVTQLALELSLVSIQVSVPCRLEEQPFVMMRIHSVMNLALPGAGNNWAKGLALDCRIDISHSLFIPYECQ